MAQVSISAVEVCSQSEVSTWKWRQTGAILLAEQRGLMSEVCTPRVLRSPICCTQSPSHIHSMISVSLRTRSCLVFRVAQPSKLNSATPRCPAALLDKKTWKLWERCRRQAGELAHRCRQLRGHLSVAPARFNIARHFFLFGNLAVNRNGSLFLRRPMGVPGHDRFRSSDIAPRSLY